ncbi:MAG: site-specific DNA-methyltransferase [Deltaproteobacteria bacterium HGW-Deltaproteobacteria-21]|nr:MAG: site-specific DNA-methyltransferase [Deltaproteobacteria bacterium HGW-Deltaproteobacteria-21]
MVDYREKFQELLRELFQFDCADLDFGIYRIMNYKREVVEKFITQDLPKAIAEELDRGALAEQSEAANALKEIAAQIVKAFGKEALAADGTLVEPYHGTPLGKKYLSHKAKSAGGRGRDAIEASIFNHLHTFFSRYYQDGDFISKRRYSKRQRYAIPYNGEEVYLYWANNDQYYVKTAEHFHDYSFTSAGVTVEFKLQAASVEQNNVKGDKRFFLPKTKETEWNENGARLTIPFEYRPLTEQEEISFGKKNQQDAIIAIALKDIPKRLTKEGRALAALMAEHHKSGDGEAVSFLEHHFRQYTRRNTSDFFIHKDLKGFLSRELDFYLKNEVLNLDEMESAGESRADGWFQVMRLMKAVGGRIIEFLDQIERFQKMLWEKRKFITEAHYCVTVGNVGESFYPEIAVCEPQWAEWKELFHIDEDEMNLFTSGRNRKQRRIGFLKMHQTLVLDTKNFQQDFVDRLLGSFDDLDGGIDGLMIRSENFQALSLLTEKYRCAIKCVYIDPPYNTGNDGFPYKDGYQRASWLTMIENRLAAAYNLMSNDAAQFVSLDDHEQFEFRILADRLFGNGNFIANVIWQKVFSPKNTAKHFSEDHDYLLVHSRDVNTWKPSLLPRTASMEERYSNPDNDARGPWTSGDMAARNPYSEGRYSVVCPSGRVIQGPPPGTYWRISESKFKELDKDRRIWWGEDGDNVPRIKRFLSEVMQGRVPQTIWHYKEVGHTQDAKKELLAILGLAENQSVFQTPKPTKLLRRVLMLGTGSESGVWVLDYFAGSGTTGHAVINMNREDGGNRKFILIEMGAYSETLLLPRVKKATFCPEWKDGKPKRMATQEEAERSPRIMKYTRLESYEDALNNIEFDDVSGQQALKFDDYLLTYMLKWETRSSDTLLNVEKLASPFTYKLRIHADGRTSEKAVDIPETFNYLIGLYVTTRKVYDDGGKRYLVYRGRIDHRQIAVIWRDTGGWQKADLERDKRFVAERELAQGADEVFVNGDSFIPNARALEPMFKARMFAEVQV